MSSAKAAAAVSRESPRPPSHSTYLRRQLIGMAVALGLLGLSLGLGMWGFRHFERMPWRDAFVNAAMLLGGEGPIDQDLSEPGKIFAGMYALYSGFIVIALAALLLAPGVHHLMRLAHLDEG
jgi:hypothetical protein